MCLSLHLLERGITATSVISDLKDGVNGDSAPRILGPIQFASQVRAGRSASSRNVLGHPEENEDNEAGIRKPRSSGTTLEALGSESRSPAPPIQVAGSSCRTFGLWKDNGLS